MSQKIHIIRSINHQFPSLPPLALTIGNFDGVHLGHQKIISTVKEVAKSKNLKSAILTFEPHPVAFFKPNLRDNFRLTSLAQKISLFQKMNVDFVAIFPFNKSLSEISAQDFVNEILLGSLNIKHLTIGHDFVFGKNRFGNFDFLQKKSQKYGFELSEIEALKIEQKICSSSAIRQAIAEGEIINANKFLGRNFFVEGVIVTGQKLARNLGFPTANVKVKPHIIKPKFGVYKSKIHLPHLNQTFNSITNLAANQQRKA